MNNEKPFEIHVQSGDRSLDFINTANFHGTSAHQEWFQSETDVFKWASLLSLEGVDSVPKNDISLHQLLELREAMYRVTFRLVNGLNDKKDDMKIITKWLKCANQSLELTYLDRENQFMKELKDVSGLKKIAYMVVLSFSDLITSKQVQKVKQCSSKRCEWFFIDKTKNQSKQWCTMQICGNREKAKRHYQTVKK